MVGVVVPRESFSLDYFFFKSFSSLRSIFTIIYMSHHVSFFLVSSYYGLRRLGLKGGILSRTVHSHRSCDIPQLCTDILYLYIVI